MTYREHFATSTLTLERFLANLDRCCNGKPTRGCAVLKIDPFHDAAIKHARAKGYVVDESDRPDMTSIRLPD